MSSAAVRIPLVNGDEVDYLEPGLFDKPRRAGQRAAAKRRYNRRLRHTGRRALRLGDF